jgi:tetratricopeptide (TPR) repeat protein
MMNRLAACVLPVVLLSSWSVQAQTSASLAHIAQASTAADRNSPMVPPAGSRAAEELHGDILMARKMYAEAIHTYTEILATAPNDAPLLNKIGVAYQQESDVNAAGRYYKRSMKADKTYASAINNLGTVEYSKKHYGRAIHLYKQAVALRPPDAISTLYSNLGYAYFADKQYTTALDCFEKALTLDPDVFSRHGSYGTTVQQRSSTDPGLFNFLVAKTFAARGDAEHCAHYLRMARDDGYKDMAGVQTDPAFAKVLKDPRVVEVLQTTPTFAGDSQKSQPAQP